MVLLFLATASIQQCTPDDAESAGPKKIQFTFSYKNPDASGGRVQQVVTPDALLLSLNGAGGTPVFVSKRIGLLHVGESYITEPIEITPGSYSITDFMLVADDSVLYLTPFEGAPLSKAVNHPLPYPLVVDKDHSTTIDMEVLAVGLNPPEDFGYAAFNINTMNPFRISVFAGTNLTDATATIFHTISRSWDTLWSQKLDASINLFSFPGDAQGLHKLVITKPGYAAAIVPFYYDSLVASLHGLPLKIMLEPGLFTIHPASTTYFMRLWGNSGTVNVDWGDGTHETVTLHQDSLTTHTYWSAGCCPVNITGDLDKIQIVDVYNGVDAINVQGLSGLVEIRLHPMQGPSIIDFTHNYNLYLLHLSQVSRLRQVILPPVSLYQSYMIEINGPNQMTPTDIDALIGQAYRYVSRPVAGNFIYPNAGPPSQTGIDKLRILRDDYGWYISPNP
jgi:hypothetical protein